jgi:hypothetical protein
MMSRMYRLKILFRRCGEKKRLLLLPVIKPRFLSYQVHSPAALLTEIYLCLITYVELFSLISYLEQRASNNFRMLALSTVIIKSVFISLRLIITKKIITLMSPSCFNAVEFCVCSKVQEMPLVSILIRPLSSFR